MRTIFCLFFTVLAIVTSAQKIGISLNEKSLVKDSSGMVYPYAAWQALLFKGNHKILAENPNDPKTAFYIVPMSAEERVARLSKMPKPRESDYFKTGSKISLFNATDIDGNKLKLRAAEGKVIVLNFWFINCPPCRREIPDLNELVDTYKDNDNVIFVALALDQRQELKNFLEEMPFKYHIVDNGRIEANRYGIKSYPTHVVIDQEGKVYFHTTGLASNTVSWIKKSIDELRAISSKEKAAQ